MTDWELHRLIALQAAEIVELSKRNLSLQTDSDFWHSKYERAETENTELKTKLLVQEGEQGNVQPLLARE